MLRDTGMIKPYENQRHHHGNTAIMARNETCSPRGARVERQLRKGRTVMPNTDLCFLNVTELAPLVRARKISPVEIVQALLSRIEALNGDLLAYLHVSAAPAM